MATSEIAKLERRYEENPNGYSFAPLAEAYRKSGDPGRALEVLQKGLALHPDYVPASIVLGRVHLDRQDDTAAEQAFSHALGLDPENVIAIKAMADITERGTRFGEAEKWLRLLLSVDRSNEDAREQLARVEAARDAAAAAPTLEVPAIVPEVSTDLDATADLGLVPTASLLDEPPVAATAADAVESMPALDAAPAELETTDAAMGWVSHAGEESVSPAVFAELDELPAAELPPAAPLAGLETTGFDASVELETTGATLEGFEAATAFEEDALLVTPEEAEPPALPSDDAQGSEFALPDMSSDIGELKGSVSNEFQMPDAAEEFSALAAGMTGGGSEFQLPDASSEFAALPGEAGELPAVLGDAPDPAAEHDEPEPPVPSDVPSVFGSVTPNPWTAWPESALSTPPEAHAPVADETIAASEIRVTGREPVPAEAFEAPADLAPAEPVAAAVEPEPAAVGARAAETEPAAFAASSDAVAEPASLEADAGAEDAEPVAPVEHAAEPDLVVTESMADLFIAQGHPAEALRVYEVLAERRPDDARLAAKVAELSAAAAVAASAAAVAAPVVRRAVSARATGGTPVRERLRAVLAARPGTPAPRSVIPAVPVAPAAATSPGEGSPTRPAPDHLSLSAVFGDEAPPAPPAMKSGGEKGVSFDEFYGSAGATTEVKPSRAAPSDDLDQFHDWLQKLKK